jgi:hypothetical protein
MRPRTFGSNHIFVGISLAVAGASLSPSISAAQGALVFEPLAQKQIAELPAGPLFWTIENFPTVTEAQAAAGPAGLVTTSGGKVWLFRLGPAGKESADGTKVAEAGPLPNVVPTRHARPPMRYLLLIDGVSGPSGNFTPVRTHPGSEAFYVIAGEITQRTPHGVTRAATRQFLRGPSAEIPMQVASSGPTELRAFGMFVLDAAKPFSSPATFYHSASMGTPNAKGESAWLEQGIQSWAIEPPAMEF